MTIKKETIQLVNEIVNYLNESNHNSFTTEEITDGKADLLAMIEQNDTQEIIDMLTEEYDNTNDTEVVKLLIRVQNL